MTPVELCAQIKTQLSEWKSQNSKEQRTYIQISDLTQTLKNTIESTYPNSIYLNEKFVTLHESINLLSTYTTFEHEEAARHFSNAYTSAHNIQSELNSLQINTTTS